MAWYSQNGRDLPWRKDARPLRDPRLGGHAPADPGRARRPALPGVARALADRRGACGGDAGRRDPGVERARVQPAGGQPAPVRAGRRRARRVPARARRASRSCPGSGRTRPPPSPASPSEPRSPRPTRTRCASSSGHSRESTCRSRAGRAYEWNQALFDLGREVCIARTPRCGVCPLAAGCPSRGRTYAPLRRQSRFEGSFRQRRARLLRAIAAAGRLPESEADAEALVSLVRDGLAEVVGRRGAAARVRPAWRRAPPAPRARAAPRRAHSRREARDRPG